MKAIAEAAGKEPKIVLYDPKAVDIEKGKGFHFRCDSAACRYKERIGSSFPHDVSHLSCITVFLV